MNLFKSESDRYTKEQLSAREAQRQAEFIAWGPVIFQVSRLMVNGEYWMNCVIVPMDSL